MKKTVISVTEAARNFADCVNRVRYQNVTFVLLKNGTPVARLVPEREKRMYGSANWPRHYGKWTCRKTKPERGIATCGRHVRSLKTSEGQMAIILDADVIIKARKVTFDLIAGWMRTPASDQLEIAAITVAELWHGIERATPPHRRKPRTLSPQQSVDRLCQSIPYTGSHGS